MNETQWRKEKIAKLEQKLEKTWSERKKEKIMEQINLHKQILDDPSIADDIHKQNVENSAFTKVGNDLKEKGEGIKSAGKSITKAGAHATGAVWTPVLYAGYQGVKHARKKPKNESIEQDLIELVKEVEQAEKQGKINEEQKREYIIDFVDNYYKA